MYKSKMIIMITNSAKQTIDFAKKFAGKLKPGAVLGLVGDLGAGKTQFAKGLAEGLGIEDQITSPTFVLLKNYKIIPTHNDSQAKRSDSGGNQELEIRNLIHIDCYRLHSAEELLDIGWEEFTQNKNNIVVVEWADKIKSIMPADTVWISFEHLKENEQRKIIVK